MKPRFLVEQLEVKPIKEKDFNSILGEILHGIWEKLVTNYKEKLPMLEDEEVKKAVQSFFKKLIALYPEPLPFKEKLEREVVKVSINAKNSKNFLQFAELLKGSEVYCEVLLANPLHEKLLMKPDLILRTKDNVRIIEFSLKYLGREKHTQLKEYFDTVKAISDTSNVEGYIVTFIPFKVVKLYEYRPGNTTQLSLFG